MRWIIASTAAVVFSVQVWAEPNPNTMRLTRSLITFEGTSVGGTITIGYVADQAVTLTIQTAPNEGLAQIISKFLVAAPGTAFADMLEADADGVTLRVYNTIPGDVFMRVLDTGIQSVPLVSNVKSISHKAQANVVLTWTLPNPPPDRIFIYKNSTQLILLPGTAVSMVDDGTQRDIFGQARPPGGTYAIVCANSSGTTRLKRFSDVVTIQTEDPADMPDDVFQITTSQEFLEPAAKGKPYVMTLYKSGGTNPVIWGLDTGALPPGLDLTSAGLQGEISGMPTISGDFSFVVKVRDSNGVIVTKGLSIRVTELPLLNQ